MNALIQRFRYFHPVGLLVDQAAALFHFQRWLKDGGVGIAVTENHAGLVGAVPFAPEHLDQNCLTLEKEDRAWVVWASWEGIHRHG